MMSSQMPTSTDTLHIIIIIKANNDIDDLNTLLSSYEARMRNILEPVEEKKIEVSK